LAQDTWERYYREEQAATRAVETTEATCWREFFGTVPDRATILDLGLDAQSGHIAQAMNQERGADWRVLHTALEPFRHSPGVKPSSMTADLPFATASVDAVSGHYGWARVDWERLLSTLLRVLRPNAEAQWLLHSQDSVQTAISQQALSDIHFVIKEQAVFRRLQDLVTLENASDTAVQQRGLALQTAVRAIKTRLAHSRAAQAPGEGWALQSALARIEQLMRSVATHRPAALGLEVERLERDFRAQTYAFDQQIEQAMSPEAMRALCAHLEQFGFTLVESLPLFRNQHALWATVLLFRRP
jgi:hypothetical protein